MGKGIQFYLQNVNLNDYLDEKHSIHLIENEHSKVDFNRVVSKILGIHVNITLPRKNSVYSEKNDFIPEKYKNNVRQMLREEYRAYYDLKLKYKN